MDICSEMAQIVSIVFDSDLQFDYDTYQTITFQLTDDKSIIIGISNTNSCCEEWGLEANIINLDGTLTPVIETNVKNWTVTDVHWNDDNRVWKAVYETRRFNLPTATVLIKTDHLPIEVVVWNNHDGYYPHSVYAKWFDYVDTQRI